MTTQSGAAGGAGELSVTPDARRIRAARLGMWIFLGSELLLFAGLFAVYAGYRVRHPALFAQGVQETDLFLGTLNTGILLTSSLLVVLGVHARRLGRCVRAGYLLVTAVALGAAFLVAKGVEYAHHFEQGLHPGASQPGSSAIFWTLYYAMTGLHAVHVLAGMAVLAWLAWLLIFRSVEDHVVEPHVVEPHVVEPHVVENGANWWHLVDMVWLFLWPLFYLLREP